MELKFYLCNRCKNIATKVVDSGVPLVCCGEEMQELVVNTVDAAQEKHVPVVEVHEDYVEVTVGSTLHPMEEKHYIMFIYLVTDKGGQIKMLKPGQEPKVTFPIKGEKAVAAYEYCNLHGLWMADV